jgi:hypothetical protein
MKRDIVGYCLVNTGVNLSLPIPPLLGMPHACQHRQLTFTAAAAAARGKHACLYTTALVALATTVTLSPPTLQASQSASKLLLMTVRWDICLVVARPLSASRA